MRRFKGRSRLEREVVKKFSVKLINFNSVRRVDVMLPLDGLTKSERNLADESFEIFDLLESLIEIQPLALMNASIE